MEPTAAEHARIQVHVRRVVQGGGFRPFVYRVARSCGLSGWVLNSSSGVSIEVEESRAAVRGFAQELEHSPPPLAELLEVIAVARVLAGAKPEPAGARS